MHHQFARDDVALPRECMNGCERPTPWLSVGGDSSFACGAAPVRSTHTVPCKKRSMFAMNSRQGTRDIGRSKPKYSRLS